MSHPLDQDFSTHEKLFFQPKKLVHSMTINLCETYVKRNPGFNYDSQHNPKRVLTKPSTPVKNEGYDNENSDYILYVHGYLGPENEKKYRILDMLGSGTFGQVVKCRNVITNELVAVKIIKNKPTYTKQSLIEVDVLQRLNGIEDPNDQHNILRLKESFRHKNHLCLVFELLSVNLYELIKQNNFKGLSTNLVRVFAIQLLDTLKVIKSAGIIHCDLKPENILLKSLTSPAIKVIDFGSSCYESEQTYTYIQSRFYRSPEVLLGLRYTTAIDMWSFGCILAELYLGLPIFPGSSEYNQLTRIIETMGHIPERMIFTSKNGHRYFNCKTNCFGEAKYSFKDITQYSEERKKSEKPSKRYFSTYKLDELILKYPMSKKNISDQDKEKESKSRKYFLDFLKNVLQIDPSLRLTPEQAMMHPFITGCSPILDETRKYNEILSLGRGILKRTKSHNRQLKESYRYNVNQDIEPDIDISDNEEDDDDDEIPEMLTGVRRKSYANTEARSSLSVSPYSRKRFGSTFNDTGLISPLLENNVDASLLENDYMVAKTSSMLQAPDTNLRFRHNKEHHR